MSEFNVLEFIAEHAGEDMITALCKAYRMGEQAGETKLTKLFDESCYMIIHVREYGDCQPCCYSLEDIAEELKQEG